MPHHEQLIQRTREALADIEAVEEKKMFSGTCFIVKEKMCVCVSKNELMCRIGPVTFETAVEMNGCRAMIHNGKTMKGFVFVSEEAIQSKKDFNYWIQLALDFNKLAKPSIEKKKK
jgi:TfoX/Sxy family transcriptional regulator of competence genes